MAKKKAVKKSAVKGKTPPEPTANSDDPNPIPKKLFKGQTFCLAGRFRSDPSKGDLERFLLSEGATVSEKVTVKTDTLLAGRSGATGAKTQAEKLNQAGATIKIINDITDLSPITSSTIYNVLTNSEAVKRFHRLSRFRWLFDEGVDVQGETFDGVSLEGEEQKPLRLTSVGFNACTFTNVHFKKVEFGNFRRRIENCSFHECDFASVELERVIGTTFESCTGTNVGLTYFHDNQLCKVNLESCNVHYLMGCTISDSEFGTGGKGQHSRFEIMHSKLTNTHFRDQSSHSSSWLKSQLSDVTFVGWNPGDVSIEACQLSGVTFTNCRFTSCAFIDCVLSNCRFVGCSGGALLFDKASRLDSCEVLDCDFAVTTLTKEQLAEMKGLSGDSVPDFSALPSMNELSNVILNSSKVSFGVNGKDKFGADVSISLEHQWNLIFSYEATSGVKRSGRFELYDYRRKITNSDLMSCLVRLVAESQLESFDTGDLKVKASKCSLGPKELKQLIAKAIFEGMGEEPPSEEELVSAQKQARSESAGLKKKLLAELQAGDVKAFNKHSAADRRQASFRKAKLKGLDLSGVNLSGADLVESDFSNAVLTGANLQNSILRKINFNGANLSGAKLKAANLRGADLTNADLSKASLEDVLLDDATLKGANFDGVKFGSRQNLCGIDLSGVTLTNVKLDGCSYDEKTILPKSIKVEQMKKMQWHGGGIPPHERKQNKKAAGPIDFDQFMARLNEITDSSRLSKATKMLKAASFELFSEVTDDSVCGIVKSQSDASLVYSCLLNSAGEFTCCTQNLNHCGGLRGALCKHILVLILGLAKSGELDPTSVDQWINSSKLKQPGLDKDRMSEVLLKYKGAEAGEIDWRPTETVPEDFFAF